MPNRNLTIETATGTAGGSMLSILANITLGDITKTIIMAIVGTVVSFFVSLLLKKFLNGKRRP